VSVADIPFFSKHYRHSGTATRLDSCETTQNQSDSNALQVDSQDELGKLVLAWVLTLLVAMLLSGTLFFIFRHLF
jgi:phosphate/sulfate permease